MIVTDNFDQVEIASEKALWAWFAAHHGQAASVWLVTFKKSEGAKYLSRDQVLDALIAHGWIDGIRRKLDEKRTMQLVSPRQQQAWAQSYKGRAARLIDAGRMHPAGLAAIAAGKASGLWSAMADVDALLVPADLAAALGPACATFEGLAPSYRRNVLRWIKSAKTAPTRAKRIAATADATARGVRLPQL